VCIGHEGVDVHRIECTDERPVEVLQDPLPAQLSFLDLSSSSSISAVKPTLKMSGNLLTITCSTVSPSGVGKNRRVSSRTYSRAVSVEMMAL
jgi:hypothetical protein